MLQLTFIRADEIAPVTPPDLSAIRESYGNVLMWRHVISPMFDVTCVECACTFAHVHAHAHVHVHVHVHVCVAYHSSCVGHLRISSIQALEMWLLICTSSFIAFGAQPVTSYKLQATRHTPHATSHKLPATSHKSQVHRPDHLIRPDVPVPVHAPMLMPLPVCAHACACACACACTCAYACACACACT